MTPVRVALVGLGDIGLRAHLPALLASASVDLVAVADPDPVRAHAAIRCATSVETLETLDQVLADDSIEAVVLATPPWATTELAHKALSAGRFVLAEKPIAVSVAAAEPLLGLDAGDVARLQVGLTYRHDPALERLREWIADGRLGSPLLLRAHVYDERTDAADQEHAARVAAALRRGTPLLHEGAHLFDWLAVLLGTQPERVDDAWALQTDPGLPAPNLTGARLSYPGGSLAVVEIGWWLPTLPSCDLEVFGPRGFARLDLRTFDLDGVLDGHAERVRFAGDHFDRCFALQLERFVEVCRGSTPARPGLAEGFAALSLSEHIATEAGLMPAAAQR